MRPNSLLQLTPGQKMTHAEAIERIILKAEWGMSPKVQAGLLRLAAVGLDRNLNDNLSKGVRDTAHWALVRKKDRVSWPEVMRMASGFRSLADVGRVSDAHDYLADEDLPVLPTVQVAAIRLLVHHNANAHRGTIEGRLIANDPRVRLAAAEAIGQLRSRASLPVLSRALALERHAVVAQALVRTAERILDKHVERIHPERRQRLTRASLKALGRAGWRTDIAVVKLVRRYPCIEAVPAMIRVLERSAEVPDEMADAINSSASPILEYEVVATLRRLTGAIQPGTTGKEWREFWEAEKGTIVMPEMLKVQHRVGKTNSGFFGIPVIGKEIAFIVDVSGSMKDKCEYGSGTTTRRRLPSRLDVAKEQLLAAVQTMNTRSLYHLITFSEVAKIWNEKGVQPTPRTLRSLTSLLARVKPDGGTNLADALRAALAADEQIYGQLTKNKIDSIFILSDGEPSAGLKDPDEILEMVREVNAYQQIRINAIFIGESDKGADLLASLAKESGGAFVRVR